MASCGDGHLLGACGANDEDDAGDGCNLPRSYRQSSSFCFESANKKTQNTEINDNEDFNTYNYNNHRLGYFSAAVLICF